MNYAKLKNQVEKYRKFAEEEIEELKEVNPEHDFIHHNEGHMAACNYVLLMLLNEQCSRKDILKEIKIIKKDHGKMCKLVDKMVEKTKDESLWNDAYHYYSGVECALYSLGKIIKGKKYISK